MKLYMFRTVPLSIFRSSFTVHSTMVYVILKFHKWIRITSIYIYTHRVSQEECARHREGVPYVKVYRYNPKHLCPNLNGYGYNGQRSLKL